MSEWNYIGQDRLVLVDANGRVVESIRRASLIAGRVPIHERTGYEYVSEEAAKRAAEQQSEGRSSE